MTRYPQLEEPLPPGHITLKDYAPQTGRALGTIETHWRPKPGFPEPVGELPSRGRHGGGRGRLVYLTHQLDAFFAANQPAGGRDHRPMRPPSLGQEARVTAGWFATNVAGVARKTVTQYRDQPTFPRADDDGTYRLGDPAGVINRNAKGQVKHSDRCPACARRFADTVADGVNPQQALF